MYIHQEFPKFIYHEKHAPAGKVVRSAADLAAHGDGWVESPADFGKEPEPTEVPSQEESGAGGEDIIHPAVQRAALEAAVINRRNKKEK